MKLICVAYFCVCLLCVVGCMLGKKAQTDKASKHMTELGRLLHHTEYKLEAGNYIHEITTQSGIDCIVIIVGYRGAGIDCNWQTSAR